MTGSGWVLAICFNDWPPGLRHCNLGCRRAVIASPHGKTVSKELEKEHGGSGLEVAVDARTGKVVENSVEEDENKSGGCSGANRMISNKRGFVRALACVLCLCVLATPAAWAAGGPLGIDHRVNYDNSGIWQRNIQLDVVRGVLAAEIAGALWEGGESRIGKTFWQSIDASVIAGGSTFVLKRVFQRARPEQINDPDKFFQGCCNYLSFPSGEVSAITASITPFVLEYGHDNPWVYALEILPAYDMVARVKTWGHWQTDVLAGYAVGFLAGWYAHQLKVPLVLSVMPHGIYVGLKMDF